MTGTHPPYKVKSCKFKVQGTRGPVVKRIFFVAFLGINQFCQVGLRFVCRFYVGNTQRLTESGFMEKPRIEPATPGLQDVGLFHTPWRLLTSSRDLISK